MNNTTNIKDSIEQREKQAEIQLPVDLRDYFAAKAMQAIISRSDSRFPATREFVGGKAYQFADAMMEARK